MGNSINQDEREFIWICLADFFSNYDVEKNIGFERLICFPRNILKDIFFKEVAVACGYNMFVTTPVLTDGFDPDWVKIEIRKILSRRDSGLMGKLSYGVRVTFYRCLSRSVWREVERVLDRRSSF